MKTIALHGKYGKGKSVIVDDDDYEKLSLYRWVVNYYGYAVRSAHKDIGLNATLLMHRQLLNPQKGELVDHVNGNKLDNRKSNLRLATIAENQRNRGKQRNNRSGHKGVCLLKDDQRVKKWVAQITVDGKRNRIGYYYTAEEASEAYEIASKKHFGKFSYSATL